MRHILLLLLFISNDISAQQTGSQVVDKRQADFEWGVELINNFPDSSLAIIMLNFHFSDLPYEIAINYFKKINPALANTKEYKQVEEKVRSGALSQIGTTVKNVQMESPSGSFFRLDSGRTLYLFYF